MKVLLTTSAAPTQAPFSTSEKRPPIGVGFLISVLHNAGHEVFFIDNYLQPTDFLETDCLRRNQIDFVGIYANTICFRDTLRMMHKLEHLRQTGKWKGRIIVGGPHTTVAVHTIPDFVDYVVQGEGERAILDIVEGKVTQRIVSYPRIENLDELPMPAWHYFVELPYNWSMNFLPETPVFTMNTSRGCPFKCEFCSVGSIWGKKYTYFSAERIVADIEYLIKHYGVKGIYFREDNFTLNKERLKKFCNLIIEKGIKVSWACESRVSNLDRDIIELMSRAGLKGFYFGVESGSQRMLNLLQKGITVEQIRNVFCWCHEFGVKTIASTIVGVPGETQSDSQARSSLLCYENSVTFCNPVNIVQNAANNKYGIVNRYSPEQLADYFSKGKAIDVEQYIGFTPNGAHQEVELYFKQISETVWRPMFSIIMANYNRAEYIGQAIESVLNQTFKDWELIIVEDCSIDNSAQVIKKYINDKRIRLIQHEKNKGYTAALKTGIANVKSEYFGIFDSDDCLVDKAIDIMYDAHVKNPDCGLIYSQYVKCNSDLNPREIGHCKKIPSGKTNLETNVVSHFKTFKLRDYLRTSGYDEDILYAEDRDIAYKMEEVTNLLFVDKCLYHYRELPNSQGHNPRKRAIGMQTRRQATISAIKRRLRSCPDKLPAVVLQQINTPTLQIPKPQELPNRLETFPKQSPTVAKPAKPRVSVIMPAYNAVDYITEAIESVLIQNYRNFELVIINDGSTDNTEEVVLSFKDERIRYFRQENRGLATTHNVGIKKSRGEFIIKLDSDDMMMPDFIARHLQEFENHSDTDLVYCDDCLINEDSKPIRVIERPEYTDRKTLIRDLFRYGFPVVPFRTCIRRSVFDKIGFFDENLRMAEDYDMMRRFVKMGLKIQHLPGALYLRRMTPDSLSRNFTSQNAKFHFDVVGRFTDTFTCDELFPDVAWDQIAPQMRQLHAKCLTAGTYLAIGQEYVKTNATEYSRTAFDRACSELNNCVKIDPENQGLRQLLQKSKLIRAKYTEAPQQVVS